MSRTLFMLLATFEQAVVPLSKICDDWLGMSAKTAEQQAALGRLPITTFRLNDSQKAPRMVHVQDLADLIDRRREAAAGEIKKASGF